MTFTKCRGMAIKKPPGFVDDIHQGLSKGGFSSHVSIWQCVKTNSTPSVHIKIAGKWMFIPLKMVLIGIDPYPFMCGQ
jgi:hypothetical protein